jgi:protein SCO1
MMSKNLSLRFRPWAAWLGALALAAALAPGAARAHNGTHSTPHDSAPGSAPSSTAKPPATSLLKVNLPDVVIQDQTGQSRRFVRDLVAGRSVAVNFIFTSCTSICSPLSATFKALQTEMAARRAELGGDVHLISISVDPLTDTPEALRQFGAKFEAGPGWTFVTGSRKSIDALLQAFGVGSGDPNDHTPMVFLGHEPSKRWARTYGLASPQSLADRLISLRTGAAPVQGSTPRAAPQAAAAMPQLPPKPAAASPSDADLAPMRDVAARQAAQASAVTAGKGTRGAAYFTNLPLMTQDQPRVRFYDDLIRNRVVLVTSFYSSCRDVCSPVSFNLQKAQALLQAQVASPVQLVSISVDPGLDTPEVLREFARRHGAGPGWAFVTGKKENIDWVLHKLGLYQEKFEQHTAVLWIGNDRNGQWLKLHALAPPEAIVDAVRKVL